MKNKSYVFYMCVFLYFLVMSVTLMISDSTNRGWVLTFFLVLFVLLYITTSIVYIQLFKVMKTKYSNNQYQQTLRIGSLLYHLFPITHLTNDILYIISLSYFNLNNNEQFIEYLNRIKTSKYITVKSFWLTVYYILMDDVVNINKYYQEFTHNPKNLPKEYSYKNYDDVLNLLLYIHSNKSYKEDLGFRDIEKSITTPRIMEYIKKYKP